MALTKGTGLGKGAKIGIGVGIALAVGLVIYLLTKSKPTPATPVGTGTGATGTAVAAPPAGMPTLSVVHDATSTDDYSITLGDTVLFYSKGDAPITQKVDNAWSVYTATSQDNNNYLLVSVLQNGNVVYTHNYV